MTGLTGAHIMAALRAAGAGSRLVMPADDIAAAFNDAVLGYGGGLFVTADQVAALVSEAMMESDYFRTTQEYDTTQPYSPFVGRSFIQVTHRSNYALFGAWCFRLGLVDDPDVFVDRPARLAELRWAALGAVWYFTQVRFARGPLTAYGGDILAVGRAVNLGSPTSRFTPAGQRYRAAAFAAVRALGPAIIPTSSTDPKGPISMSTSAKYVYKRANQADQEFAADHASFDEPGQHQLTLSNPEGTKAGDVSLAFGPLAAVDARVGIVVSSQLGGVVRFVLVDYLDGEPTTIHHERLGQTFPAGERVETSTFFLGSIGAGVNAPGGAHQLRLRVVVESAGAVTVHDVQSSSYSLS